MKAVIMAGGAGSRLRPLTCDRPKPMTPVLGKPVMEYAVELLKEHGISDIGVTLQYMPEEIKDYFGDGQRFGVNLHYFVEETPLGTAGSVKNAAEFLDEPFVVISGDALTDFYLPSAVEFHAAAGALATLVLTTVEAPLEYGVVITENDGKIRRFLEKPGWGEVFSDQVNTGIYVLQPEVLEEVPPDTAFDFSKNLFPKLLDAGKPLFGVVLDGYWCDIGSIDQYRQAHFDLLAGKVNCTLPGEDVGSRVLLGKDVNISRAACVQGPVYIGDNAAVGADARVESFSVLGTNVIVGEGATVKRSIIWENSRVGKNAALRGAVVCKRVIVGDNVSVFEGAAIGDETEIGDSVKVKPEVKIWPHKVVEKGTVVNKSIVWGTKTGKNLFGGLGVPGLANLDITPEFAARLGGAFGGSLNKGEEIVLTSDGSSSARMISLAFASGVVSTGVNVLLLDGVTPAVCRFAVPRLNGRAGVHVKTGSGSNDKSCLHFLDARGVNISRDAERKIESGFVREDYRRAAESEIGRVTRIPELAQQYRDYLRGSFEKVFPESPRVVVFSEGNPASEILESALEDVGCVPSFYSREFPGSSTREDTVRELARLVSENNAHFAVMMDRHAERVVLVDNFKNEVAEDLYAALLALVVLELNQGGQVVVPVSAPGVVEKIAERLNGRVVRSKTSAHAFLSNILENGSELQLKLESDSIFAVLKVLELLVKESSSLPQLLERVPPFFIQNRVVPCAWEDKGAVLRTLTEEEQGDNVELLDGIKIKGDQGWSLILPDAEEPSYHIRSEGFTQEIADSLTDMYHDRIRQIVKSRE